MLQPTPFMQFTDVSADALELWYRLVLVHRDGHETASHAIRADAAPTELQLAPPRWAAGGAIEIRYTLPAPHDVRVDILSVDGRRTMLLDHGRRGVGQHVLRWDGHHDAGGKVASGLYVVRLDVDRDQRARKFVYLGR